jgi:DNA-binding NarL/FixJ family response regulator
MRRLHAARAIRAEYGSTVGIVLLTQHIETRHAVDLLSDGASDIGYLLKDRVLDPAELADAIRRVAGGWLGDRPSRDRAPSEASDGRCATCQPDGSRAGGTRLCGRRSIQPIHRGEAVDQ